MPHIRGRVALRVLLLFAIVVCTPIAGFAQDVEAPPAAPPSGLPNPTISRGADVPPRLPYIDEMLEAQWSAAGIQPSPLSTDAEYLRRAYLDLLGRIPNVDEAQSFLRSEGSGKRAKLIDYLLSSPDYPKNMAGVFTNHLIGRRQQDQQVDRAALTTWLRQQFAENRPWSEIAGELVSAKGSNKENGAANFALAHIADDAVNLTAYTTRMFLGQQIQCTQCHDHPTNDWKQADFWGINAFFRGLRQRPLERIDGSGGVVRDGVELYDDPADAWARFERRNAVVGVVPPTYLDGRRISPGLDVERRAELSRFITEPANDQFARAFVNRMWAHLVGRGFVHPVDDFGDHNPPSHPELLDQLAADFRESGYDVKSLIRWIAASRAYQVSSSTNRSNTQDDALFSHFMLEPMSPEQLFDSLITATSAHKTAGGSSSEEVRSRWLRQFVVAFANDEAGETTTFQGTIPQALMMMNGELMARAVGDHPGNFLSHVLDQARLQRRVPALRYVVDQLYLAAYARSPNPKELRRAQAFLESNPDTLSVLQDLFWALLNSNEFILNH
jgi:hypothetical protein